MLRRLALLFCLSLIASHALAVPTNYTLQKDQSRVAFIWRLGQDAISGTMPVARADISLDFDAPANSRFFVVVDAAKARAGAPFAGEAMKGQSVLWTDRHPEITFQSKSVRRDGEGGAVITGDLTVRGVTRPQTFTARLFRPAGTVAGDRSELTVRLNGSLSRRDFGADGYTNLVGNTVTLDIRAAVKSR